MPSKSTAHSQMFLCFQWHFCLLLGNGYRGSLEFSPKSLFRYDHQMPPRMQRTRRAAQVVPCFGLLKGGRAFLHGFGGTTVWRHLCHFHKLYLGTDRCGPIHVDGEKQPEPAGRGLGQGLLFLFQTTHTCTVNKRSKGHWSTHPRRGQGSAVLRPRLSPAPTCLPTDCCPAWTFHRKVRWWLSLSNACIL